MLKFGVNAWSRDSLYEQGFDLLFGMLSAMKGVDKRRNLGGRKV